MFAIAFDLVVADTERHHPIGVSQAYTDIAAALKHFGFRRIQGSVYVTENDDMANLFQAIMALKALPWVPRFSARHPRIPHRAVVRLYADDEESVTARKTVSRG